MYSSCSARSWDATHTGKTYQGPALCKLTDVQQILSNQQVYIVENRQLDTVDTRADVRWMVPWMPRKWGMKGGRGREEKRRREEKEGDEGGLIRLGMEEGSDGERIRHGSL